MFFAHTSRLPDPSTWQLLSDHLRGVAVGARERCLAARPKDAELSSMASCAGLLHELGTYAAAMGIFEFTGYL